MTTFSMEASWVSLLPLSSMLHSARVLDCLVGDLFVPLVGAVSVVVIEGLVFLALEMFRCFDHYSLGLNCCMLIL